MYSGKLCLWATVGAVSLTSPRTVVSPMFDKLAIQQYMILRSICTSNSIAKTTSHSTDKTLNYYPNTFVGTYFQKRYRQKP